MTVKALRALASAACGSIGRWSRAARSRSLPPARRDGSQAVGDHEVHDADDRTHDEKVEERRLSGDRYEFVNVP